MDWLIGGLGVIALGIGIGMFIAAVRHAIRRANRASEHQERGE